MEAIAINAAGEAGAHPSLSIWCVTEDTPILTADLRWVPAGSLGTGAELVGFGEESAGYNCSRAFAKATVTGFERKVLPCREVEIEGDEPLRATPEHRWLIRRLSVKNRMFWCRTDELRAGDEIAQVLPTWEQDQSWDGGYVAGALDGEGHITRPHRTRGGFSYSVGVCQLPGKHLLEKVAEVFDRDGIRYTRFMEPGSRCERIRIDRKADVVKALGRYRPMRLLEGCSPDHLGHLRDCTWRRVLAVKDVGPRMMACIATDTKTYVARGYAAHNTELWGFVDQAAIRLWDEMTPIPTEPDSVRWVETYAGYEGESELLYGLYERATKTGRQLTNGEFAQAVCRPDVEGESYGDFLHAFTETNGQPEALVPIYVDEPGGLLAYWDDGLIARRMPWQQGEAGEIYYRQQESQLPPRANARLHQNLWMGAESSFVPIELWDDCYDPELPELAPGRQGGEPMVLAVDAASTGDCFAVVGVTRHPADRTVPAIRKRKVWYPSDFPDGRIDYLAAEDFIREVCKLYNVKQIAYDPFQLEDMMQRLRRERVAWCEEFPQGKPRLEADRALYDRIMQHKLAHMEDPALPRDERSIRAHLTNTNGKMQKDDDSKLRMIKKAAGRKIDLAVATSMACARVMYLNL
jgi:hypothetical protein